MTACLVFWCCGVGIWQHLPAQEQFIPADIDSVGDRAWRRQGVMNGNLLGTVYFNTGQVSKDRLFPQLEWPVGSGHIYMDTVVPFVAAQAHDVHGNLIHPLETNYEFSLDVAPDGITEWGWQPLPGYLNPAFNHPAISHRPETWPAVWPDRPDWAGFWNGFFGKGILNADQETYYVVDDDADEEFEFFPDSTDPERRGIGMRMSVRGLQWSQVLAEDAIFWIFDVTNVGTTSYDSTLFGMFIDSKNGGHDFDNGFYDTFLDLTYIWDQTGIGTWGGPTGWIGYGYLESPGMGDDGIDNDEDGLTDENRDSGPGDFIFGPIGIYGPPKFHWSGDEDGDWNPETDDVGADGLGPLNEGYPGPDPGEGDGIPTDGEPNFDRTDLDESDQIGLQAVSLHSWGDFPLHEDDLIWSVLASHTFDPVQNFDNIGVLYSSGPFPLAAGRTERFSLALLMGEDFDDLVRNKDIVQRIFNANYRFARPPDKPHVRAIAGDGYVTLTWDNRAEFSRDPFLGIDPDSLGFKKDFEGYAIYRSTDPGLLDARLITDAFGNTIFRKPLAQFDRKNGIKGTSPVGLPNGAHFYLGDDTGLAHTWTDTNVVNGQTYYYAVVAYDAGDPNIGSEGLPPSETTSIIERDELGRIHTDVNTAMVTPGPPSAGYRPPEWQEVPDHVSGNGTGHTEVEVVFPRDFRPDQKYQILFHDSVVVSDTGAAIITAAYSVVNENTGDIVVDHSPFVSGGDMFPIFDGLGVKIFNHSTAYLPDQSGLTSGQSDFVLEVSPDTIFGLHILYPADYEIRFADQIVATSRGSEIGLPEIPVNFTVHNLTEDVEAEFLFYDYDQDQQVSDGDEVVPLIPDDLAPTSTGYRTTWRIRFVAPPGGGTAPQAGDVFTIRVSRPFRSDDLFEFETHQGPRVDSQAAKSELDRIKVVPNPYIVTNPLEPRNLLTSGRGERVILFTHLPRKCTIRIYNLRGYLVDIIEHDSDITDGQEKWDLVSREGIDVAFGVYIYHVESEFGTKIGRFAIIK
ncbi:MAG: hypothetical protein D6681_19675 [Calditrichaeota bacterium]|nr:MAG: hypothetical protein D6681_19675 [Calditrichota bacterium]